MRSVHIVFVTIGVSLLANLCMASGAEGVWGEPAVIEELRIGLLDGEAEYMFGQIRHIAVTEDGSIFIADGQLNQIREYDSRGEFRRMVGLQGQGPGEYQRLMGMETLPNNQLAVLTNPHRLILYDIATAKHTGDFRVPSQLYSSGLLEFDMAGHVYVKDTAEAPAQGSRSFVWIKTSLSGEVLDRIPVPDEDAEFEHFTLIVPEGALQNFPVVTCCAWSPLGYVIVGRNDEYSFDIMRPDGTIHVAHEHERVRLHPEEKAVWEAWAERFDQHSYKIPWVKPAYRNLYVGDRGRIWVDRYVEATKRDLPPRDPGDSRPLLTWRERKTFDAFEPDGTFLGTVVLPDARIGVWRENRLWGVQTGDQGEQLVRWRIRPSSN
jgi:hypothetical protein